MHDTAGAGQAGLSLTPRLVAGWLRQTKTTNSKLQHKRNSNCSRSSLHMTGTQRKCKQQINGNCSRPILQHEIWA